jgi:hypothetical protein
VQIPALDNAFQPSVVLGSGRRPRRGSQRSLELLDFSHPAERGQGGKDAPPPGLQVHAGGGPPILAERLSRAHRLFLVRERAGATIETSLVCRAATPDVHLRPLRLGHRTGHPAGWEQELRS